MVVIGIGNNDQSAMNNMTEEKLIDKLSHGFTQLLQKIRSCHPLPESATSTDTVENNNNNTPSTSSSHVTKIVVVIPTKEENLSCTSNEQENDHVIKIQRSKA